MTVGQEFHAYAVLMREEIRHLQRAAELLLELNLGATAIGTRLNTPEGYAEIAVQKLAEVSGLPVVPAENLVEATSDTGAYVSMHAACQRVAAKLGKICNDLRLLSSGPRAGLNEINLPKMQAGSSIMPAKVNPVIPEVVNQVCFKVMGNDVTVGMASEAGQLQLNVMEPVIAQTLFESIRLLTNAARTLRDKCVVGITVNEEVCRDYVMNSIGLVTYLTGHIGHHAGRPCRPGVRAQRPLGARGGAGDGADDGGRARRRPLAGEPAQSSLPRQAVPAGRAGGGRRERRA